MDLNSPCPKRAEPTASCDMCDCVSHYGNYSNYSWKERGGGGGAPPTAPTPRADPMASSREVYLGRSSSFRSLASAAASAF